MRVSTSNIRSGHYVASVFRHFSTTVWTRRNHHTVEALQEIIQGLQSLLHAAAAGPRISKPHRDSD